MHEAFTTDSDFCPGWRGECNLKKWKEHKNIYLHVKYTCTNTVQFVPCDPWPAREERKVAAVRVGNSLNSDIHVAEG
jgi:hypothetical protein